MFIPVSIRVPALSLLAAGYVVFAASAPTGDGLEFAQVSRLFSQAQAQASQLKVDADWLESYTRSNVSWETQADLINRVKEHVNKMGRILERIEDSRAGAAPWQQTGIDRIVPMAKELVSATTRAIERLDADPRQLDTPDYLRDLEAIYTNAGNISVAISNYADYGTTERRLHRPMKMELPAGGM